MAFLVTCLGGHSENTTLRNQARCQRQAAWIQVGRDVQSSIFEAWLPTQLEPQRAYSPASWASCHKNSLNGRRHGQVIGRSWHLTNFLQGLIKKTQFLQFFTPFYIILMLDVAKSEDLRLRRTCISRRAMEAWCAWLADGLASA